MGFTYLAIKLELNVVDMRICLLILNTQGQNPCPPYISSSATPVNQEPSKHPLHRAMENYKVSLKILVDTKGHKVLFAEAGKDFVDFLFTLLALPLGTVAGLLEMESQCVQGSIGNLYQSIKHLNQTYIQPGKSKESILKPPICATETPLLLPVAESFAPKIYLCSNLEDEHEEYYVADNPNVLCPNCECPMSCPAKYTTPVAGANKSDSDGGGFVKGVVTYMVMDNLEVTPMSTISSISLINKYNIQDIGALVEKVVEFGIGEGLKLLKVSLEKKAVLTSVFLG